MSFFTGFGNEGASTNLARPWTGATDGALAPPSSSKRRRSRSSSDSENDSDYAPLPPHPLPTSSSNAPSKKKKKSSRPAVDMSAVMQTLLQAIQQQQQPPQSSSDPSEEDLDEEVPLPPVPNLSPLDDDLALSSSDNKEAPAVPDHPSPTPLEASVAEVDPPQPEEASYPDLLSHPPPLPNQELDLSSLDAILGAPPIPPFPPPPSLVFCYRHPRRSCPGHPLHRQRHPPVSPLQTPWVSGCYLQRGTGRRIFRLLHSGGRTLQQRSLSGTTDSSPSESPASALLTICPMCYHVAPSLPYLQSPVR